MENHTQDMVDAFEGVKHTGLKIEPVNQQIVDEFSTHFAAYFKRGNDLLVHLYPRNGGDDVAYAGKYLEGNKYRPARLERPDLAKWPQVDMKQAIFGAADKVWQGDVAIVEEETTGVWTVQFQNASPAFGDSASEFVDSFCEILDSNLDGVIH